MTRVRSFLRGKAGATSIEYAMIAGCISIAIVLGATSIGIKLNSKYISPVSNALGS